MSFTSAPKIVLNGLAFHMDMYNPKCYLGPPLTNILPNGNSAGHPTTPSGWGTYNTNQYGSGTYFSIGTISSVSGNIVTCNGHSLRTYDVVQPQTTGGGVTAGTNYLVRKWDANTFSLYTYDGTQDGYNPFDFQVNLNNDNRVAVSSGITNMWWGYPHLPNAGIMKQVVKNGFNYQGRVHDCMRLHWYRADGVCDGMAYGNEPSITSGQTYTVSFYHRAATPNAVGKSISFQRWTNGNSDAGNFTLGKDWQKFSYQFTTTQSGTTYFYWFNNNLPAQSAADIAEIMIYQGTGSSEYVSSNATRSNTKSLFDLTGKSIITASSLTYNSDKTFSFNGSSNYIDVNLQGNIGLGCLDIWYYNNNAIPNNDTTIGGPSTYQTLVQFNASYPTGVNLGAWTGSLTNEAIQIWSSTTSPYYVTYNRDYVAAGWHNTVFNWTGSRYDIWTDGVKTTTYDTSSGYAATLVNLASMQIGYSSPGYYFNGRIPVVKAYDRGLTDQEVLQNFNVLRKRFGI